MAERSQCVSAAVFFAAARRGDADQVSLLLEQQPSLALQLDAFGKDALYYTQLLGHREVTELLQGEAAPLQQDRLPASLPGVVLSNEPQILRDEQEAMNAWDGAQDIAFQTTNGAWEHIIPTAPAMPSRQSPTLLNRGAPGSEVFHERTSPYSTSLREVFSMRGVRPSPSSLRRDSAAGPRTNGWVAQQLDFTDAQQRMGQTRPGTISRPLPAPFEASHLDRRLRDPHLPMGQARSGLVSDQVAPTMQQQQQQQMGVASPGQCNVGAPQTSPLSLEQIGQPQSRHASPSIIQQQTSSEYTQPLSRAHSARSTHSRGSPTPLPTAPRSESARRAYRFIDDIDAPSSGDDLGLRARHPSPRPLSPIPHIPNQRRGQHDSSSMPGRRLARDSPLAARSDPAVELPYADLLPIMGRGLARDSPPAGQAPSSAFIDDRSGDELARRPLTARQLPAARPTSGWIEEPTPAAAGVWQDGHWRSAGGAESTLNRVNPQDMSQPAAAAAAGAEAPQRITPGMRREQEERHRERMRRGGGNRRSYAFIDVDISSSDDEGYQADMMRTGSTHSSTAGAARVASQQDLPAWAGAASQPPSTTRSFWAARGGVQPPPEEFGEAPSDWEPSQHFEDEPAPSFSHLSRPSPFSGTFFPAADSVGSENEGPPWGTDANGDQQQWGDGQVGSDAASAEGSAAGSGYMPILEGVQQAFSNMLRLPFVWGAGQEQAAGPPQPNVPVPAAPGSPQQEQENRAPNAVQGAGSSQPVPSPSAASPTPPKSPSGSKNVEVNAVAQSTDANLCKVCFSNAADTLFEPCRHLGLCRDCANEMETCPFCRKHIRRSAT
ncbi:hypothetical protein WJX74_006675 [Apatococcus lobatus]|uniref:RING-type domain-containing protein n=1 Tax=Apatococcus lobatus TaxID=904363 RepID=A0AAW1RAH1_9CHLO